MIKKWIRFSIALLCGGCSLAWVGLWVRSYSTWDNIVYGGSLHAFSMELANGSVVLRWDTGRWKSGGPYPPHVEQGWSMIPLPAMYAGDMLWGIQHQALGFGAGVQDQVSNYWFLITPDLAIIRHRALLAPHWFFALAFALPPILPLKKWLSRRKVQGLCPVCSYDLRVTPDRCPECGWGAAAGELD